MSKRVYQIAIAAAVLGVSGAWLRHVRADGIPSSEPLSYAGTLQETGMPVTGMRAVTLILWDSATATTNPKCQTTSPTTQVTTGRFRIPLDSSCTAVVSAIPDLWIEVLVGGVSLGRKKLGAVPYAVEASRASSAAGTLANQIVPPGAVMFFNLSACPAGWTAFAGAQGRYVVGVPAGGTLNGTGGTALANLENRPVGQHSHSTSDPGHNHGGSSGPVNNPTGGGITNYIDYSGTGGSTTAFQFTSTPNPSVQLSAHTHGIPTGTTGISINNSGSVAGTNAPYVQLLACQKN